MKPNIFFRINKIVLVFMMLLTISSKIFSQNNNDMAQSTNYTYATVPTQFVEANGAVIYNFTSHHFLFFAEEDR